ncbi:MAG: AmmeMemoRadiSam system protein B [Treponema sp.]|nr:AmmeMemoRadiSam system protein B [Treponema sp.]
MQIRDYSLPNGWYPRNEDSAAAFLSEFKRQDNAKAAVAPHAGWYYSGSLAALAVSSLKTDAQAIVVLGGHLPSGSAPLFAMEDAVRTPFGAMQIEKKFRSVLYNELKGREDRYRDNTIEVLLPMVHYFFPEAKLIWLRLPSGINSYESGRIIRQTAAELNLKINVLASTDLTHYGSNYGFSPHGSGREALRWVREVNDAAFIKAVESGSAEEVLRRAETDQSSCSAGAVLGAMGYAKAEGLNSALLLKYATSADAGSEIPDSFVGYAAFSFV